VLPSTAFAPAYCDASIDETTTGLFNAMFVPVGGGGGGGGGGGAPSLNETFEMKASLAPLPYEGCGALGVVGKSTDVVEPTTKTSAAPLTAMPLGISEGTLTSL